MRPSPRSVSCQAWFRTCPLTCKSHHVVNGREHFGLPDRHPFTLALQHGNFCCPQETSGLSQLWGEPRRPLPQSTCPDSAALLPQRTPTWRRDRLAAGQMVPLRLGEPPAGDKLFVPPGVRLDSVTRLCVRVFSRV